MASINELAARVRLLLMDVDGVLTDGRLLNVPDASGKMVETKGFDSQDGADGHGLHDGVDACEGWNQRFGRRW